MSDFRPYDGHEARDQVVRSPVLDMGCLCVVLLDEMTCMVGWDYILNAHAD